MTDRVVTDALLLVLSVCTLPVSACTTLAVGKHATTDGSTMCAHSNDGDGDTAGNLMKIAMADWPNHTHVPRHVSNGAIPQVPHTHAYFTKPGGYASVNEFQVGLAESTCNSHVKGNSTAGAALNIVDLSELGLERANTSRMAVQTMGSLAEQYGCVALLC